jgi:hypothetical protein
MRNKRQLTAALMIAAILGSAMPLSADMGGGNRDSCFYIEGLALKVAGNGLKLVFPDHVIDKMLEHWSCQ